MDENEKTRKYMAARARPGEKKTVTFTVMETKNFGLSEEVTLRTGYCPCSICGHEYMWECEETDCLCCSSACT